MVTPSNPSSATSPPPLHQNKSPQQLAMKLNYDWFLVSIINGSISPVGCTQCVHEEPTRPYMCTFTEALGAITCTSKVIDFMSLEIFQKKIICFRGDLYCGGMSWCSRPFKNKAKAWSLYVLSIYRLHTCTWYVYIHVHGTCMYMLHVILAKVISSDPFILLVKQELCWKVLKKKKKKKTKNA